MKNRSKYLDILRGIAIGLMVLGHCIQYGNGMEFAKPEVFFQNKVFQLIYSFHMPLFMLISGYLFSFTAGKCSKVTDFIKNRLLKVLLPIAGWQVLMYFLYAVKLVKDARLEENWLVSYIKSLPREYWFLWAVFYCSIAVYVVRHVFKDHILVYFIGLILTFWVPDIVYNLPYYKFMYPFFVAGYLFAEKEEIFKRKCAEIGQRNVFLGISFCFLLFFCFWNYDSFIYTSGYTLYGRKDALRQFGIDIYRMVTGFLGSAVIIQGGKIIYDFVNSRNAGGTGLIKGIEIILAGFGKYSLGIYIISGRMVEIFLIGNLDRFTKDYFINILQAAVILGVSYIFTVLISKQPVLNFVLLGGRKIKS